MKLLITSLMLVFASAAQAQVSDTAAIHKLNPGKPVQTVETACGQCKFGMPGEGCHLAVRINGKAYFVDGTRIDDHGDAHAKDGFCNAVRKAKVQGQVVNNRFQATYFTLVKPAAKKE